MQFRRQHRRLIALLALFGMLFQQFAMAAYVCPMEARTATMATTGAADLPPCPGHPANDGARCAQHCNPSTALSVHADALSVPPALVPGSGWLRELQTTAIDRSGCVVYAVDARTTSPPLTIQHCTFQI